MFTLGNKLNRLYSMQLSFMDSFCEITVVFNKSNSFIGFNVDQRNYIRSRNNEIRNIIFQDLSKSGFSTSFLDIRDYKSKNLDIKRQFHNILPAYKDHIHYETNETIKLSKIQIQKGSLESCIYIYVFRITDLGNDFIYCLAERQHIDVVLDKKIVRTCGLQLCSNDAYEDLTTMIESSNRNFVESENIDSLNMDIFAERKNIKDL